MVLREVPKGTPNRLAMVIPAIMMARLLQPACTTLYSTVHRTVSLYSRARGFKSLFIFMHTYSKRDATRTSLLLWCAMRDLNPHGRPPEPKSGASANSANRACFFFSPKNELERKTRFELATLALARRCSTPEPLPHTFHICKAAVSSAALSFSGDSTGNRTRVTAVKGRCLDRLTMEPVSYTHLLGPL